VGLCHLSHGSVQNRRGCFLTFGDFPEKESRINWTHKMKERGLDKMTILMILELMKFTEGNASRTKRRNMLMEPIWNTRMNKYFRETSRLASDISKFRDLLNQS
jgi:hypothetical protein